MLRLFVLLLFVANLVFYVWTQGALDAVVGFSPDGVHEPQRLASEVHPERVQVLSASASAPDSTERPASAPEPAASGSASGPAAANAAQASAPAAAASVGASEVAAVVESRVCLEAGPYTSAERAQIEPRLRSALMAGTWEIRAAERPGLWLIYMGPYADAEMLEKKKDELRRIRMSFTDVNAPAELAPGLALGRFEDRAAANAALTRMNLRGIRTARVVTLRAPQPGFAVRMPQVDAATRRELNAQGNLWMGRALAPCPGQAASVPAA